MTQPFLQSLKFIIMISDIIKNIIQPKILIVGRGPTSRFYENFLDSNTFTIGFHREGFELNFDYKKIEKLYIKNQTNIKCGGIIFELGILINFLESYTFNKEVLIIGFDFNSNNEDDDIFKNMGTNSQLQKKIDIESQIIAFKRQKKELKNIKLKRIGFDFNSDIHPITKKEINFKNNEIEIVAEITTNHFGSTEKLIQLIEKSASAGAKSVKLQMRNVEKFYSKEKLNSYYKSPFGNTFYDYRKKLELTNEQINLAIEFSKKNNVNLFFSVLDIESFEVIKNKNFNRIKLPSTISEKHELLNHVSKNFNKELVISTGMTSKAYENLILEKFIKNDKLFLLHCISSYPTFFSDSNILVIKKYSELAKKYNNIIPGYSSHDVGSLGSILAIGQGAKMIEKHVKIGVTDWAHFDDTALDVETGFFEFCDEINRAYLYFGSEEKKILDSEFHKY